MVCEKCGKTANVHLCEIKDGKKTERHLCAACCAKTTPQLGKVDIEELLRQFVEKHQKTPPEPPAE